MHFDILPKGLEKKIKEEMIFYYNGLQFNFNFEELKLLHGKILIRFHINTFLDVAKEITDKVFINGSLLYSNIDLKCYFANIERQFIESGEIVFDDNIYKIYIIGEVTKINIDDYKAERRGKWIPSEIPNELYVCSECGGTCWYYDINKTVSKSKYCPNCGARMR